MLLCYAEKSIADESGNATSVNRAEQLQGF
jgi:hypothetical protein